MSEMPGRRAVALALAGRRIDAEGADTPRFPLSQVETVRRRLHDLFVGQQIGAIVRSAAYGADLVALEEAGKLGIRRRVVLPFAKERFRQTSVVDRPGNWGEVYDHIIADVETRGDLIVLPSMVGDEDDAYWVLQLGLNAGAPKVSLIAVWDGNLVGDAKGGTAHMVQIARAAWTVDVAVFNLEDGSLVAAALRPGTSARVFSKGFIDDAD